MELVTLECPKCRAEMFDGAHFCIRCGTRLDAPVAADALSAPETIAAKSRPPAPDLHVSGTVTASLAAAPAAASVSEALSLAALDTAEARGVATVPLAGMPSPRHALDASLSEIDADFGALAPPVATLTHARSATPASPGAAPKNEPPPRRQSTMAEHSRDEVLRRARIKQSMKRAGLAGIDLSGGSLEGVDFSRADLEGANLQNAKLRGACLKSANLRNAKLQGADLAHADLDKADLEDAVLDGANLEGTNLDRASLEGASLSGANLVGAQLAGAELTAANLGGAVLRGADLSGAELTEAELSRADLSGANLTGADLEGATLDGAVLAGAMLPDAVLRGASAIGANFDGAHLERACFEGAALTGAVLGNADARHALFDGAKLDGALLHRTKLAGARFGAADTSGVSLDFLDISPGGDGSVRLEAARALAFLRGEEIRQEQGATRYFGKGDVLRDATLEFGDDSRIHVDSRFDNCSITLGEGAELTIGEAGVLKNCAIAGRGRIIVHGRFFERQSPGIVGVRSLFVSARGGIVGGVEQVPEGTHFAFEPGSRLRLKILRPRVPAAAE